MSTEGLSTHLMERNTRAFLSGVTAHPGVKLALLTLSSRTPHAWTDEERHGLGEAIGFISQTLSDVEGRRHHKESEARFRALSEHSGAGIFLIANKKIVYVNHALQSITGYSEPELRDQHVWRMLHPSHRALAEKAYPHHVDAPVAGIPFETQLVTKAGQTRWIESRAVVIELSGEPTMLGTVLDITDRKQAEARVQADERRFREMLEDTLDGVAVLVDGRIVYANPTLARTFGIEAREVIGMLPTSFLAPDDRERAQARIAGLVAGEVVPSPSVYRAMRPDGTGFPVEVFSRPTEFEGRPALLVTFRNMTAWRQAEDAVRRSEEQLRTLLEHQADGVAVSADGRLVYGNRALASMFGVAVEDLRHADPLQFLIAEERPRALERARGLTIDHDAEVSEHIGLRGDGTTFPLELVVRAIEFGGQSAVLTTYRDLTETKRVESAIREAEAKYRNLVENSLAGVYIIQDERYIYVNPRLAEITGYEAAELLALSSYVSIVVDEDKPLVEERVRRRLAGETPSDQYRVRARRKDGQVVDLEILGATTTYSGKPAVIGTVLDVTARQRAENRVRESERRFRTLFEQAPIGIVTASADGVLQRVNRSFCDMLGYSDAELIGSTLSDIIHPDDVSRTPAVVTGGLETTNRAVRVRQRFISKSGASVQAETTVSVVRDDTGQPHYTVAMIEDVTEKQRLEEQLNEMLRLESVGRLAGGIAHSFNNALAAISGYSELLARRFDRTDPALRDLEQIQRVAEQSAQVTRQLLAFSRDDEVTPSVFNLNDVVESTHDLLSAVLGTHIRVRLRLDRDLPDVSCDRPQIEQIVTNLVLNARDAMPNGGTLQIETAQVEIDDETARAHPEATPGCYVRLVVQDTGSGMSDDTVERIFEPFFTTKDPGKGVGLGLAMVHGAVRQNGGFIEVETAIGQGSTFTVCLPGLAARDAEADSSRPQVGLVH